MGWERAWEWDQLCAHGTPFAALGAELRSGGVHPHRREGSAAGHLNASISLSCLCMKTSGAVRYVRCPVPSMCAHTTLSAPLYERWDPSCRQPQLSSGPEKRRRVARCAPGPRASTRCPRTAELRAQRSRAARRSVLQGARNAARAEVCAGRSSGDAAPPPETRGQEAAKRGYLILPVRALPRGSNPTGPA